MSRVAKQTTYIIGHTNPDTDSICSAISYADLKHRVTGKSYTPMRAGEPNAETEFVLRYFDVPLPSYLGDVRTQVMDIDINKMESVNQEISLKKAWEAMGRNNNAVTLPIVEGQKLQGLITIGDIAKSYMSVYDNRILASARTPYINIIETLDGEMIVGDADKIVTEGKVLIAAANPDLMENYIEEHDIVILGNRYESQLCAIEMGADCIIVCDGAMVSFTITKLAASKGCAIIKTPFDTYTATRLINQSMPVRFFMKASDLVTFSLDNYIDDIRDIMAKKRHRDFPVLDWNENFYGMISRRQLLEAKKKNLILVDHNEKSQAVDGLEEARIHEIIDHHRLGSVETLSPVFFRNEPLGCTATIIYKMYQENQIDIPQKIAGLLCAAILSDTLIYRSPTCTDDDRKAAEALAKIAGIETEDFAKKMFAAGSNLKYKSPEEIFYQDFKKFAVEDVSFGIGQITSMNSDELASIKEKLVPYMHKAYEDHKSMIYFMLTDIMNCSTELLYEGDGAKELAMSAFHIKENDSQLILPDTVSRKKQVAPALMSALSLE